MKAWWNNGVKTITTSIFVVNRNSNLVFLVKRQSWFISVTASAKRVLS